MRKKDKILISFYVFLGISLILSLSYIDSTFGCNDFYTLKECEDPEHDPDERPFIQFGGTKLNEIKTESTFNVDKEIIFNIMANVGNYHNVLPQNVLSVKIIEEETNLIIAEHILIERGIKVTILAKHTITPYNEHIIEILDGDAKGTKIIQTFIEDEGLTKISTDVELKLKGILKPVYYLPKNNFAHAIGSVNTNFVQYTHILSSENAMIIDGIYRDLLQRPVDQESLGFWLDGLENATITEEEIRNQVLNSTEKKMLEFNSLSIDEQLMIISNETKTIINNLYLDVLDRPVDKNGLAGWGILLENELMTEEEIRELIEKSEEKKLYYDAQGQYEAAVREIFMLALDREPTQDELEYYTKMISDREIEYNEIYEELLSKNE